MTREGPGESGQDAGEQVIMDDQVDAKSLALQTLSAYHSCLAKRPLLTKAITSAIVGALGDILASLNSGKRNVRKTVVFALYGGVITGPLFHWWYGTLERICAGIKDKKRAVAVKVLLDRLLLTPPFLVLTLFSLKFLVEGKLREAKQNVQLSLAPALLANWKVWTPAQLINFTYVPPAYRVLFGNLVALWWSFYLSRKSVK